MNDSLYELIDRKYFKEIRYNPQKRELSIDIQNKDVIIRFFDKEPYCIMITVKMDNKQNKEIYNIVKNELLNVHEPYQDFIEIVEEKENDKNIHSVFAICFKMDVLCEEICDIEEVYMHHLLMLDEMHNTQKEYMNYLLDVTSDFDKDVFQQILNAIKENKDLYVIVHGEEETKYEIFL